MIDVNLIIKKQFWLNEVNECDVKVGGRDTKRS